MASNVPLGVASSSSSPRTTITTRPEPYPGPRLPLNCRNIRVLRLDRPTHESRRNAVGSVQLSGEFCVVDLDEPDHPPYIALSYVWGRQNLSNPRTISIRPLASSPTHMTGNIIITENCHQALSHIVQRFGGISIWVDAICINQTDETEKGHQVHLMGAIYSSAGSTYVWLGNGDRGTDRAMKFLRASGHHSERLKLGLATAATPQARKAASDRYNKLFWEDARARFNSLPWSLFGKVEPGSRDSSMWVLDGKRKPHWLYRFKPDWFLQQRDLDRILENEWLTRAWTFQEFVLSKDILLLCGLEEISWEIFLAGFWDLLHRAQWHALAQTWLSLPRNHSDLQGSNCETHLREVEVVAVLHWRNYIGWTMVLVAFVVSTLPIWLWLSLWFRDDDMKFFYCWLVVAGLGSAFIVGFLLIFRLVCGHKPISPSWERQGLMHNGLINTFRRALLDRRCFLPKDQCFSIYGVLQRCGLLLSKPDYELTTLTVFIDYISSLTAWNPQYLLLIIDSSLETAPPDSPSWVPNWTVEANHNLWLPDVVQLRPSPSISPLLHCQFFNNKILRVPAKRLGVVDFQVVFGLAQRSDETLKSALGSFATFMQQLPRAAWKDSTAHSAGSKPSKTFFSTVLKPKASLAVSNLSWTLKKDNSILKRCFDWFTKNRLDFLTGVEHLHLQPRLMGSLPGIIEQCQIANRVTANTPIDSYVDDLLRRVKQEKLEDELRYYMQTLHQEDRSFVITSSKFPATGSSRLQLGDELFYIPCVPTLMALRRRASGQGYEIVGPASGPYAQEQVYTNGMLEYVDIY